MPRAVKGTLIECDPAIHALILSIDKEKPGTVIIEELDDAHLMVASDKLDFLKKRLNQLLEKNTYEAQDAADKD